MKNLLNNLPPFYIGQIVEAIKDYPVGNFFKKGDEFEVLDIQRCLCGRFEIFIGIKTGYVFICHDFNKKSRSDYFYVDWFIAKKQNSFPLIKLKHIKEKENTKNDQFQKQILIPN